LSSSETDLVRSETHWCTEVKRYATEELAREAEMRWRIMGRWVFRVGRKLYLR
jgi:hypothetical protein